MIAPWVRHDCAMKKIRVSASCLFFFRFSSGSPRAFGLACAVMFLSSLCCELLIMQYISMELEQMLIQFKFVMYPDAFS